MRSFLKALTIASVLSVSVLCDSTLALEKYVTPAGGGLLDGSSWANAYSNIQDAVNACTTAGDAIYLQYGVYTNFSQIDVTNRPGLTIRGGYLGAGTPGGFTNAASAVTRALTMSNRIFYCNVSTVTLDRVTITNGYITSGYGGGLYLSGCQTVITNCTLEKNVMFTGGGSGSGGGCGIYASGGTLTVTDSVLRNNSLFDSGYFYGYGGGLYSIGAMVTLSAVIFDQNYIYTHYARGGGVYLSGGSAVICGCTFTTNSARGYGGDYGYGGAIYANEVNPLPLSNCVFRRNYASGTPVNGGVMYLTGVAMEMADCEITENSGGSMVEDVYINTANWVSFRNSIFTGGSSNSIYKTGSGALSLTNCLIYSNAGHGVYTSTGTVEVVNTTLANNTGWGVTNEFATIIARNCIAWGNTNGGFSANCVVTYTDSQEAHAGAGNLSVDPVFVGATTNNYRLSLTSPCVNAGTNEVWMVNATDLAGERRIRMGRVDMGAYETTPPKGTVFGIRGQ